MKTNTYRVTIVLSMIIAVLIGLYFIVQHSIESKNRVTITQLDTLILEQEKQLLALSELTRANAGDDLTNKIVFDCTASERDQFDNLLDLLSRAISPTELNELNNLFFKCGSFFADRKSVMSIRLIREVEILASLLELRKTFNGSTPDFSEKVTTWKQLAATELKSAEYFFKLVDLQGTIITELKAGKSPSSPVIVGALNEVNSVRRQMLVLSKQIEVYKAEVINL
jgi:hypothetical protein